MWRPSKHRREGPMNSKQPERGDRVRVLTVWSEHYDEAGTVLRTTRHLPPFFKVRFDSGVVSFFMASELQVVRAAA